MNQNIGRSFSRSQITESGTQRTTFYWVEPGRVLRRELVGNGIVNNLDFTMNPATGAPFGYTVLEDGALATDTAGVEGAGRMVIRFVGDQFAVESQQFKRGQWAQWRVLGMARGNNYWRSDAAIAQAQQSRNEMLGVLMQGAVAVGQGYVAGAQEANEANARSQAIIDAAAESDRQYRAAQTAAVLAQRVPQRQSVAPLQQADAPTRRSAPGGAPSNQPRPEPAVGAAPSSSANAAQTGMRSPSAGGNLPVHLYCYRWIEARTGERTSYVSQVGAVPKTAPNPEIESRTVARWSDYLNAQGIGTSGIVGCRLDTDRTYNAENRSAHIGTARSRPKDTLRELAWSPS